MKRFVIKTSIMGILMIILLSIGNFALAKEFEAIQLTDDELVMSEGETSLMLYTVTPAGSDNIENKTWLSHDSEIVEVDENGKITAKKEGMTDIELVINGKRENGEGYSETAKCQITVEPAKKENTVLKQKMLAKEAKVEESTKDTIETNFEKVGMSTKTKLILLITIIGLIVIFILIGTASDKKQGKFDSKKNTEKKKEKGEEKKNAKKSKKNS